MLLGLYWNKRVQLGIFINIQTKVVANLQYNYYNYLLSHK